MSSSSSSRHFYSSFYLSFYGVLQKAVRTRDVTNPVISPSIFECKICPQSRWSTNSGFLVSDFTDVSYGILLWEKDVIY